MKRSQVAVLVPVLLASGTIVAQTPPSEFQTVKDELKKIAAVTDDGARLKQYDGLAKKYNPDIAKAKPESKWKESVSINPLDDAKSIVLINDELLMNLMIRHSLGKTELYVCVDKYLGEESASVIYRVGKAEAVSSEWAMASNNKGVFFNGDIDQLIMDMCSAEQFVVQITPYGEVSGTAVFDIRGLKPLLLKHKDDFGYEFEEEKKEEPAVTEPAAQPVKNPVAGKVESPTNELKK